MLGYYRKRRNERAVVHSLLTFLWGRRTLYLLYQEHPEAALEFVQKIQSRLKDDLERLPNKSRAYWPVREMHEACLKFLIQTDPLTRTDSSRDAELLSDKWAGSVYRRSLVDALLRLREIVNSRMDELYEECGIERPSSGRST